MREAVIVEAVRTPFGKRNGALRDIHPVLLGTLVLKELVERTGIDPAQVDDVVWGCVGQVGEQSANVGRNTWLAAGFPVEVPATTVDRQCGSSQQALHFAANLIQSGIADVTVAGGVDGACGCARSPSATALMCVGVVPQQPPTSVTPASANRLRYREK